MGKNDLHKLQQILGQEHIIITEYYCVNYECHYIKCFLTLAYEFILVYIPSSLRFTVPDSLPVVYNIEERDKETSSIEPDDYTKAGVTHDVDLISTQEDEEKSIHTYQNLKSKYERHITMDSEEEPVLRKIKRQIERLQTPFNKINYKLALQRGKYFSTGKGGSDSTIHSYIIRRYPRDDMCIMYSISLPQLLQDLDEIARNINIVKKQFLKILKFASFSNLQEIPAITQNQIRIITEKIEEYEQHAEEFIHLQTKTIEKEKQMYSNTSLNEKPKSWFGKYQDPQKALKEISSSKLEMIEKGMPFVAQYHKKLILLEEISFDSNLMLSRVEKNFQTLQTTFL